MAAAPNIAALVITLLRSILYVNSGWVIISVAV
jgi:hypothetical protein